MNINQAEQSAVEQDQVQKETVTTRMTQYCEKIFKKTVKRNHALEEEVTEIITSLQKNPEYGVELNGNLLGFKCVHSKDNQFRVIYQFDRLRNEVTVHSIGHRGSVYEELTRYLKIKSNQEFLNGETSSSNTVAVA